MAITDNQINKPFDYHNLNMLGFVIAKDFCPTGPLQKETHKGSPDGDLIADLDSLIRWCFSGNYPGAQIVTLKLLAVAALQHSISNIVIDHYYQKLIFINFVTNLLFNS